MAERLTRVPGSSAYFRGGAVAYSNAAKTAVLERARRSAARARARCRRRRRRHSRAAPSSASAPTGASASPASRGRAAGARASRWGSSTSPWPAPTAAASSARRSSPAIASACGGRAASGRSTCCAASSRGSVPDRNRGDRGPRHRPPWASGMRLFVAFELPPEVQSRDRRALGAAALRAAAGELGAGGAAPSHAGVPRGGRGARLEALGRARCDRSSAARRGCGCASPAPERFRPGRPARVAWIGVEASGGRHAGRDRARARASLARRARAQALGTERCSIVRSKIVRTTRTSPWRGRAVLAPRRGRRVPLGLRRPRRTSGMPSARC